MKRTKNPMSRSTGTKWIASVSLLVLLAVGLYVQLPGWAASHVHLRPATMVLKPDLGGGTGTILRRLLRGRLKVKGEVWVDNQTWFDIELQQLTWAAVLKGRKVVEGTIRPGPVLLSDREAKLTFSADVLLASLGLAAVDVLKVGSPDIQVDVTYSASALGMTFSNAVRLSGFDLRMDAHQIPLDQLIREPAAATEERIDGEKTRLRPEDHGQPVTRREGSK